MSRNLYAPTITDGEQCLPIHQGGTSVDTVAEIPSALNLALASQKGIALGLVPLDSNGKVPVVHFPSSGLGNAVSVDGNVTVTASTTNLFQITDYDSFKTYTVTSARSTVSVTDSVITYIADETPGADTIVINGRTFPVTVVAALPNAPIIGTPVEGDQTINSNSTFVGNGFSMNAEGVTDTHESSDWQLATDAGFTSIAKSVTANTTYKTFWDVTGLAPNTTYYLRVRYKGVNSAMGAWSNTVSMKTLVNFVAITPSVTSPANGATGLTLAPTFTSSAFASNVTADTHQYSDWQVATDAGFTTVVKSTSNDAVNKTSWSTSGLLDGTLYYVRVRHKGNSTNFSNWSTGISFTTAVANTVTQPTATFSPVASNGTLSITNGVTGSAFTVSGGSDTHLNTDWQIATDAGFTAIATQLMASTSNKTTWTFSGLSNNVQYYFRFRYRGNVLAASPWSNTTSFKTYFVNGPVITSPSPGATNINPDSITFTSAAFSVSGGSDSHASSDWQVATDVNFNTIVKSATADAVNKTSWTTTGLALNVTYYVRARHRGTAYGIGEWGATSSFITFSQYTVTKPNITSPANGATAIPFINTFTSNAFSTNGGTDTHASSDWQVAYDSGFTNIAASNTNSAGSKTSWNMNLNKGNTVHYLRVRHKGNTIGYSAWSNAASFTTGTFAAITPVFTLPANGATGIALAPTFTTQAFASEDNGDAHQYSDWQVSTNSGFTNIVKSSVNDSVNKTSWSTSGLTDGTQYWVRTRHKGTLTNWSPYVVISFTTAISNSVNTPSVSSYNPVAINGTLSLTNGVNTSAFSVTGGSDTHHSTDWQIATDFAFTNIVTSVIGSTSNKTTWTFTGLGYRQTYYLRFRYKGNVLPYSSWSTPVTIETYRTNPTTLTSPANGATDVGIFSTSLTTSAFGTSTNLGTHASTLWELSTDGNWGAPLWSSNSTSNKTSITIPFTLEYDTLYYVRVRHYSDLYDAGAATETTFRTLAGYTPNTPTITSPTNNATGIGSPYTSTSSAFSIIGSDTHASSDWQVATVNNFSNAWGVTDDAISKTSCGFSLTSANTVHYVRVRHKSSKGVYSNWSAGVSFTTRPTFAAYYQTTTYPGDFDSNQATQYYTPDVKSKSIISKDGNKILYVQEESIDGYASVRCNSFNRGNTTSVDGNSVDASTSLPDRGSFGWDFAIDATADRMIVSIPMSDTYGTDAGKCYIYKRGIDGVTGYNVLQYEAAIGPSPSPANLYFGAKVCMSDDGTRVAVYAEERANNYRGYVQIFVRTGTTWAPEQKLIGSPIQNNAYFGCSLAFNSDGSMLIVGARQDYAEGQAGKGAVYTFTRSGSTWTQVQKLTTPDPYTNTNYGYSVALSTDGLTLAVGSPEGIPNNSTATGLVCVYTKVAGTWNYHSALVNLDNDVGGQFGKSIAISADGKFIAVTQSNYYPGDGRNHGWLYMFELNGGTPYNGGPYGLVYKQNPDVNDQRFLSEGLDGTVSMSDDAKFLIVNTKNGNTPSENCVFVYT